MQTQKIQPIQQASPRQRRLYHNIIQGPPGSYVALVRNPHRQRRSTHGRRSSADNRSIGGNRAGGEAMSRLDAAYLDPGHAALGVRL